MTACSLVLFLSGTAVEAQDAAGVKLDADDPVNQAYLMRMSGQAGDALSLLEYAAAEDSTNAEVWYELARTRHQMGLHDMNSFVERLGEWQRPMEKAVSLDPDNVIYLTAAGRMYLTIAYVELVDREDTAGYYVKRGRESFERVLQLDPYFFSVRLLLIEMFLGIHPQWGGDPERARDYVMVLEQQDPVYGALAREMVLPADSSKRGYWISVLEDHPSEPLVVEALARAFVSEGDTENSEFFFRTAIRMDPGRKYLLLEQCRAYMMKLIGAQGSNAELMVPRATRLIHEYLDTGPVPPMAAYAHFMEARFHKIAGNDKEAEESLAEAKAIDPWYAEAFGMPDPALLVPPGYRSKVHLYLLRSY